MKKRNSIFGSRKKYNEAYNAWNKYQRWAQRNRYRILEGGEITSWNQFKEAWIEQKGLKGSKLNRIKGNSLYQTDIKTGKAMKGYIKELGRDEVSLNKLRTMNTHEAVKKYFDAEIRAYYQNLLANGMSIKDASANISTYFFGS